MSPSSTGTLNFSTGPRTESGKARSSRNATTNGLFAVHHLIPESEAEEYAQTFSSLLDNLSPEGVLEETFATEIMGATWRLRRCRLVEAALPPEPTNEDDPAHEQNAQKSIDRARAQSHNLLRRSLAELRRLQTERSLRAQREDFDSPGLADTRQILNTLKLHDGQRLITRKADGLDTLEGLMAQADRQLGMTSVFPSDSSFCNPAAPTATSTAPTPRNAPCPCGSGTKYKRCCGTGAPPQLNITRNSPSAAATDRCLHRQSACASTVAEPGHALA